MGSYSIADAKNRFTELVQQAERHSPVEITRRGRPVAVLISIDDYERLRRQPASFAEAYDAFRREHDLAQLAIEPALFADIRPRDPGRDTEL
ncbi:MAG: type II toxin-antitoxin system Phd/YefM family antitoxin [Candidatus Promineofilum sp.]|nr:type II toxin-antitoxin system Phd/YefM family antitoxin [Promineifilum sp.]MCW5862461.1 type II toxin-antitoxin system Phd/YefM family antitoxin [Anaerolineae bacterium]